MSAQTPAPPTQPSLATEELARLADAGQVWACLGPALINAHDHPDDAEAGVLALRVLAQLGLGVLAREAGVRLDPDVADRPDVLALLDRARDLPTMEFAAEDRVELGRRNIASFAERRGVDLRDAYERWAPAERGWRILATPDGNVIRVPVDVRDPRAWMWLSEQRSAARAFCAAHFANAATEQTAPIAVEGFSPPWVFVELTLATPRLPDGYQPIIRVLQRDPAEFFEGASLIDLSAFIGDDRIEWYIGDDAADRFAGAVRAARGTQAVGPGAPIATVRTRVEPSLGERINALSAEIVADTHAAGARVEALYAGRDASWWATRYAEALSPGSGDPLRVLVPTTRYSTFVQHSAGDLARAFDRSGARTEVLIEPDDRTRLSALAYHETIARFEPDLIVLNNYPRCEQADVFPANVPFVCWIQDEMPHLFEGRVGRAQGELDFVIGHAVPRLFDRFGYDASRALFTPVVVSPEKFHPGPITPEQRERFACEVAFVSHHSETPDAMHARKMLEAGDAQTQGILENLFPRIIAAAGGLMKERAGKALRIATHTAMRDARGCEPDASDVHQLELQYSRPLLERMVRHNALASAADVCERRGWRLRVFGRGWEEHPRFGAHAGGELEHGDDLRACYQAASVHLHPSAMTLAHQRVMECALSGGLPIGVRSILAFRPVTDALARAGVQAAGADACRVSDRALGFACADSPELLENACTLQRAGVGAERVPAPYAWIGEDRLGRLRARQFARSTRDFSAEWLLGDPAELTFRDAAGLEQIIERATDGSRWRASRSEFIAFRVRERLTHDGLAKRTLDLITDSLAGGSGPVTRSG